MIILDQLMNIIIDDFSKEPSDTNSDKLMTILD